MKSLFEYKIEILLKEVEILSSNIKHLDNILFRVKNWGVTFFSGFVIFAFSSNVSYLLLFECVVTVLFWSTDAIYKSIQRKMIVRYNKIEHYFRTQFSKDYDNDLVSINLPDIGARVSVKDSDKKTSILKGAFYIHTSLIYIVMIIINTILFFCFDHFIK